MKEPIRIAFANQKGGVGKTTLTIQIAGAAAADLAVRAPGRHRGAPPGRLAAFNTRAAGWHRRHQGRAGQQRRGAGKLPAVRGRLHARADGAGRARHRGAMRRGAAFLRPRAAPGRGGCERCRKPLRPEFQILQIEHWAQPRCRNSEAYAHPTLKFLDFDRFKSELGRNTPSASAVLSWRACGVRPPTPWPTRASRLQGPCIRRMTKGADEDQW